MLYIYRRIDVDSSVQQLLHVLVTLFVAHARRVRMREFIHQDKLRMAFQRAVEVEFIEDDIFIAHLPGGKDRQSFHQLHRFRTRVWLDITDDYVDPAVKAVVRRPQHCVGFSNACGISEEYL